MNEFLSPLRVQYLDGKRWLLTEAFAFTLNTFEIVRAGVGEITDFASIPRPLKTIWPSPGGPWDKPAVLHDSLHVHPFVQNVLTGGWRRVSFEDANQVFLDAMIATETHALTRRLLFEGVSSEIGRALWDGHRRDDATRVDRLHAQTWWITNPWERPTAPLRH